MTGQHADRADWLAQVADDCLLTRRVPMLDEGPPGLTSLSAEADWVSCKVRFRARFGNATIVCSRDMPASWPHPEILP